MTGMAQARRSSASISASAGLPRSVRSPVSTSASASREISAKSSRKLEEPSSFTCRSPIAATRSVPLRPALPLPSVIAPLALAPDIGEAPLLHVDLVVDAREHAPAADLHLRRGQVELLVQTLEKLVQEPARDLVALRRIDPAEVEDVRQQHLPMHFHVGEEPPPVDLVVRLENGVRHVGAVVAVAQLDEALRPHELGRADDAHGRAEDLYVARILEPLVADRHGAVGGGEDHVEEMLALVDLAEPALVLDLDGVAELLEVAEDARVVASLAEDVEVLRGPRNAGVGGQRIGAGEQERQPELRQLAQGLGVEALRLGVLERRLRLGAHELDGWQVGSRFCLGDGHALLKLGRSGLLSTNWWAGTRFRGQNPAGDGCVAREQACQR